jgi:dihydroorotase-like cyclic amidohydrolase
VEPGADADLVVIDPRAESRVEADEFYSKAKYSPYEGMKIRGEIKKVILRGTVVYEDGEVIGKRGYGRPLFPRSSTPLPT